MALEEKRVYCQLITIQDFIMGKCIFNRIEWPKRYTWVWETSDKFKAHCRVCRKDIDIAKMGESAVWSHAKGESHEKKEKSMTDTFVNFFIKGKQRIRICNNFIWPYYPPTHPHCFNFWS